MANPIPPRFLDHASASVIADAFGSPAYVYDKRSLVANAEAVLAFPNAFGLTARYAMKASPNAAIVRIFDQAGLHFDASSGHEVRRMIAAGVAAKKISLSAQELPDDLGELLDAGIDFNACSLAQLDRFGQLMPGAEVGVRLNPGAGSGGNNRTNVGGPSSSFGIWHEWVP
ncbi:MAG: diaminopimelate decarboxylase, partial [Verrucomicrobiota bacterium]